MKFVQNSTANYSNSNLNTYWDRLSIYTGKKKNEKILDWLSRQFLIGLRLLGKILSDAGIELFYLIIFWLVISKMSQGRDLIVSLFEPDGIYQFRRVELTILTVVSFSLSMWIIPAFLFQQRDDHNINTRGYKSIFKRHLFFVHRVLPLIPFWLLAFVLFNEKYIFFMVISVLELVILHRIVNSNNSNLRKRVIRILFFVTVLTVIVFFILFRRTYQDAKVAMAVLLYLLSFLMFFFFHKYDNIILQQHQNGPDASSRFKRYKQNSIMYIVLLIIHLCLVVALFWWHAISEFAPESILLYIFSLNIFFIDLLAYIINVNARRRFVATIATILIVCVYIFSDSINLNLRHYAIDETSDSLNWKRIERVSFETKYRQLKEKMDSYRGTTPYPIILIAGEGGGSRAGIWFSQNIINFDYYTKGKFRDHIFSMSTVSGSSVGLGTLFAYWQYRGEDEVNAKWLKLPSMVYQNNFVGNSISGLLFTDLWKSLFPLHISNEDRNSRLQDEEALCTQRACNTISEVQQSDTILKKNFLSFFYDRVDGKLSLKSNRPIVFINTCRSDDGRRGIFSPIRLGNSYFNDAIDIVGYLYDDAVYDDIGNKVCKGINKGISLGQACNTSELFPLFSAPAYIDSLGSFVDGGYHENSGLKTTLDVYRKLNALLKSDTPLHTRYQIYIVYLKNSGDQKDLYASKESSIPLIGPLMAFANQPFQGSASYFEEQAKYIDRIDSMAQYLEVRLNHQFVVKTDSVNSKSSNSVIDEQIFTDLQTSTEIVDGKKKLNFPLARWLSKSIIRRIYDNAALSDSSDSRLMVMLQNVANVNHVQVASLSVFSKQTSDKKLANKK